jgi:aminocarboxymuconate-semialdehyde decarboxylase
MVPLSRRAFLELGAWMFTAAQARQTAARGKTTSVIDVHAHFYPRRFLDALAEEPAPPGFSAEVRARLDPTFWDLSRRIERMDAQGVTLHALSLSLPMVHWAAAERGARLARIVNDTMSEAHLAYPDRFVGCAALPVQDPAFALRELDRAAELRGIRAVYLPTSLEGRELSDPALLPLYARCEALHLPVLLHPVAVIGAERLQGYYLRNLLGNPFDTAVAAAQLVFGGVLDRHPSLEVVLPHGGGALPYLAGRLEHGQKVRPETRDAARRPFHEYLRRFHYDTVTHSPEALRYLVDRVGADRVMLGSDYCFDMGYERPREIVMNLGLRPADREKILGANAARLLGV